MYLVVVSCTAFNIRVVCVREAYVHFTSINIPNIDLENQIKSNRTTKQSKQTNLSNLL